MSQANVEIVRRAIEGWNSGELDDDSLIGELFDPDFEWVPARDSLLAGGGYRGFAGLRRFRADLFSAWDEYALEAAEFVDAGDQVVAVVRIRARTRGIEVDEVWSALLSISEGRITRFQGFASREGTLEAAGLPKYLRIVVWTKALVRMRARHPRDTARRMSQEERRGRSPRMRRTQPAGVRMTTGILRSVRAW